MSKTLDDLAHVGKRGRVHDTQVNFKCPSAAKALIKKAATAQGLTNTDVIRIALAEYLDRRGYK